ncbi:type 2 lantipeptide synthetase LanM [Xanthomonas phaseoli]|nr:type 2 lantipeptide synthetase LanM [Xanthomonas phaseoli]
MPNETVEPGSDASASLTQALRQLDEIEWPQRASQVEPAPFPTDASVVDLAWRFVVPAADWPGDAPPVPAPYDDPLAGIAEQAFGAEIECLQERVSVLLDGAPLRWGAGAVMTLVDGAYTRPLQRLWARGWAAAFNQLKLDGRLGLDARVSHLTSAQRALVVATARDRYSRLSERMGAMRDALLGEVRVLCLRLTSDMDELAARCCGGGRPQVITRVVPLGDRHRSGWVGWVQLSDEAHSRTWDVVYKPRSIGVDKEFYGMAAALAQPGDPTVHAPWFLDCGAYGWMEYCDRSDCANADEVEAYYERLGWLTALVFVLEGRDCHAGNVVARGASPVFVDLECIFTPAADRNGHEPQYPPITATAVLPMTRFALGAFGGMDVSGFAGGQQGTHYYQTWRIVETPTGALTLLRERRPVPQSTNVPRIAGASINPYGYCAPFLRGMRRAFARLQSVGSGLLSFADTVRLNDLETRIVLRNTSEYVKCLEEATAPCAVLSGDAEDMFLATALKPVPGVDPADERDCLCRGVIPRHGVTPIESLAQRPHRPDRSRATSGPASVSGVERVRTLLDTGLSSATVAAQLTLAEQAFAAGARNARAVAFTSPEMRSPGAACTLLARAIACIDTRLSVEDAPDWITATSSRGGALVLTRMHWGAFTGRSGMAAAYAAAEASGVVSAQRTLARFRRATESNAVAIAASLPIEGLDGCAGVLAFAVGCGMETGRSRLQDELLARLRAAPDARTIGPMPAGTLIGLTAAFELDPAPALAELIDARLHAFVCSPQLARLIDRDVAAPPVMWASPWAMVLATARAARAVGNWHALAHVSQTIRARDLKADTVHDRLVRLRLLLDAGDESDSNTLWHEIAQLRSLVSATTLGSQYGLGALLGAVRCARERSASGNALADEITSAYLSCAQAWLDACEDSVLNRPLFVDAARGIAGVVLRLTQMRAKKQLLGAFIF